MLLVIAFASVIVAQTAVGSVNGTVMDPNGGAVSGAVVKLISQATNIETDATTNDDGYFTFVNVKPASYIALERLIRSIAEFWDSGEKPAIESASMEPLNCPR